MQAHSDKDKKDKLDRAEAVALAGMYFHADLAVPADAFRHPGRRAVVMAWKQLGQVCDGSEMQMLAEQHADRSAVTDARTDIVSSEGVARDAARWKESCAYVIQHHAEQSARERLDQVTRLYERGDISESAVAQAWERLAAAKGRATVATPAVGLMERLLAKARDWHGRKHIGIPVPSLPLVTEQMDGLRGLMFLGGEPGTGKTSLALQLAFDAVDTNADTVGVFVSCEMSGEEIIGNLATRLAEIPYRELLKGRDGIAPDTGLRLRPFELFRLGKAHAKVRELSSRWAIITPSDLGGSFDGKEGRNPFHAVVGLVDRMKAETGATRAVVVFDNLQAMPVAEPTGGQWRGEQALERDRYTIAKLNELTDGGALDSVIVISEQNKSGQGKDDPTSFLGTGRINYAADATVFLVDHWMYGGKGEGGETLRLSHYKNGMRWVVWSLKKGRAGMDRGIVEMTYDFRLHRFVEGHKTDRLEL